MYTRCFAVLVVSAMALQVNQPLVTDPPAVSLTTAMPASEDESVAGPGWCRNGRLVGNMYCMSTECEDVGSKDGCATGPNSEGTCCVKNIMDTTCRSAHHISCALPERAFSLLTAGENETQPPACKGFTWVKLNTQMGNKALGQRGTLIAHFTKVLSVNASTTADLVITANSATYKPPPGGIKGGRLGGLGFFGMSSDVSQFSFQFHKSGSEELVPVEKFWFSIYGIDASQTGDKEYIVLDTPVFPYTGSFFTRTTNLRVKRGANGRMRIDGSQPVGMPRNPFGLSADQQDNSASFFFNGPATGFSFRYGVTGPNPKDRSLQFAFLPTLGCAGAK